MIETRDLFRYGIAGVVFVAVGSVALVQGRHRTQELSALRSAYPAHTISIDTVRTGVGKHSRSTYYWVVDGRREKTGACTFSDEGTTPTLTCPTFSLTPATAAARRGPGAASGGAGPTAGAAAVSNRGQYDVTVRSVTPTSAALVGANGTPYTWTPASPAVAAQLRAAQGRTVRVYWESLTSGVVRVVAVGQPPAAAPAA